MGISVALFPVATVFRHVYQTSEAFVLNGDIRKQGHPNSLETVLFKITKLGVASLDLLSTTLHRFVEAPSKELKVALNVAEGGLRLFHFLVPT